MAGIGRHPLTPVDGKLFQSAQVAVFLGEHACERAVFLGLFRLGVKLHLRQVGQPDLLLFSRSGKDILQLESPAYVAV